MSEATHYDRRRFIGTAVMAMAATRLVESRSREPVPASRGDSIEQIGAGDLHVGFAETGASNGPPAILLRDGNTDVDVAPLAANGYRVIVPSAAVPSEVMALMAALEIEKALVGGIGESARTAEVMAALWPQRLKCIAPVSGSVVVTLAARQRPLPPKEELAWWYRYYFAKKGEA